ncbi:MAG: long-chain fatty acid--CoA ligase [Planctomycetes bacterium]|nr:long-chain fatty acid--CoA ligase [Planctomycetota bacterium]
MTVGVAQGTTITQRFLARARDQGELVALRRKVNGRWEEITWRGYADAARKIGQGLLKLGLEKGQAVSLLSETRAEWAFSDMGILCAGGVTVPIYHSCLEDEVQYILKDANARFLLLEDLTQWAKVREALPDLPQLEKVVIFDTRDTKTTTAAKAPFADEPKVMTLDDLLALGEDEGEVRAHYDAAAAAAGPDDVVTLIYTSGTTGNPKGVVLTHKNATAECEALAGAIEVGPDDVTLAFLPLAHVFARALHWLQIAVGYQVAFAESITKVVDNMGEIRPTFFAAVPRVYEKIHGAVAGQINALTGFKASYVPWALQTALERQARLAAGEGPGFMNGLKLKLGGPALKKLSAGLGGKVGGRMRFFVSGGAPLSPEIAGFFRVLGFTIYEGYGLTETTAATHINTPEHYKLGTVGRVVKGVEQKIASDGEILVRGGVIMREYHNQPEATAEVLKDDGWFHTGDIGVIDEEGFLKITDRKKDILITAAGKNIAPQIVENHVKTHRFVSQVCLFGDKRKFCVALLTVDEEQVRAQLTADGVTPPPTLAELVKLPQVRAYLQQAIDEKNADLPSYETIKYFELLPAEFEVGDELTPSLKVKRKVVAAKYGDLVDALYAAHGG